MFFVGILIGVGIYFLAMFIWEKFDNIWWSLISTVVTIALLFDESPSMAWGVIVGIVGLFGIGFYLGLKEEQKKKQLPPQIQPVAPQKPQSNYKSHCWHCGNPINGSWNRKCPDCNKYYICPKCGACKCDFPHKPPFKH